MGESGPGIVVLSGPSGVGKTTIARHLQKDARFRRSISATTRPRRPGEVDGKDYFFLSPERFREWVDAGEFIETAEHFGNRYGTPRKGLEAIRAAGGHPLLDVDVQGCIQLRRIGFPGVYIFLSVPDLSVLRQRLERRGTDPEEIQRRLARYEWEMSQRREHYDFEVENRELPRAIEEVERIIQDNLFR